MLALGLDLGASSVKLALLENGKIKSLWMQTHQGRPFECLQNGLEMLNLHEKAAVCVTGANSEALLAACPDLLAPVCPFFMAFLMSTQCYGQLSDFLPCAALVPPLVLALLG